MSAWLEDTLVAGVIALLVAAAIRVLSLRPALAHLLWITTLGVLLMPRVPWITTPGAELRQVLRAWLGATSAPAAAASVPADPALDAVDPLLLGVAQPLAVPEQVTRSSEASAPAIAWRLERDALERALWFAWLAGAVLVLVRSARRILPFHRLVRRSPLAPRALQREVLEVARRLGVRAPEVRLFGGVASPSIWCLGRPRLLWPAEPCRVDSRRARAALIAHELAHLARKDHWVSWLEIPAAALAWWNPLFWWIRGRIRHFAELSCDAWAVWAYPADRRAFAEALIDMQARTRTAPVTLQGLGATDSECKDFERRLDMIMKKGMFPGVSRGAAALAAMAAVLTSPGFPEGGGEGKTCAEKASGSSAVVESRARGVKLAAKAGELLGAKQYEAALPVLQEAVALDPQNGWAHGRLGYVQIALRQFDAAEKSFQRQYDLGFERPGALYDTSCALALAGDSKKAMEYAIAAARHGFGDAELMAKDSDLASLRDIPLFRELLEMVRATGDLRRELARLEQEGNTQLFLATHAELCSILLADGKLQAEHGHLALKAGDYDGAALAFGRQAEAGVDAATAYYNRACALSLAGDTAGALADLQTAAERGMGYEGISQDKDLDAVRALPGFADVQAAILAKAAATKGLKTLLSSSDEADAPRLAALVGDASQSEKIRALAAQSLGKLQLAQQRFAEAYGTFSQAAELGIEVRQSAFGMAQALAGVGKNAEALRNVELALDLGYADPDAVRVLLEKSALASPAEAEVLVARAAKALEKSKAAYGEKGKAWAAGLKKLPVYPSAVDAKADARVDGKKVAQDT